MQPHWQWLLTLPGKFSWALGLRTTTSLAPSPSLLVIILLRQGSRITFINVMIFLKLQCSHSLTLGDGDLDVDALSLFG